MPRWAAKVDTNQTEIVDALEKMGWIVVSLSRLGGGVPDLLMAKGGRTVVAEVKTATGRLRDAQEAFLRCWPGEVWLLRSVEDVLRLNHAEPSGQRSDHPRCQNADRTATQHGV